MSVADRIAREAQAWLAAEDSDYSVVIEHARSYNWFYLRVFHRDRAIYNRACCRSYRAARWRVRRVVRAHRKFLASVQAEGAPHRG